MFMNKEYLVKNPDDFQIVISDILNGCKLNPLVITLEGDLGAGKTTFAQELGRYLEVAELITSPTFTIMKQYELVGKKFDKLVHIDAYRIESENELKPLRLEEIFARPNTIVCVEWPELIKSVLPDTAVPMSIKIAEGENRVVIITIPTNSGV